MTRFFEKNNKVVLATMLIVFCLFIAFFAVTPKIAEAADEPVWDDDELVVGHITDTHIYPVSYLYKGEDQSIIEKQLLDRKFTAEATFWENVEKILVMKPDYLIVSGDLTHNGERKGHIDIANGLRDLQNRMRTVGEKPDFQIFTVYGNHDLYNGETYDFSSGSKVHVDYATRKDLSIIYAGLGFPNITDQEAQNFYTFDEYEGTYSKIGFTNSSLAENMEVVYNFDPEEGREDYTHGDLSYIAKVEDRDVTFYCLDVSLSNVVEGHVLGGRITQQMKDFMEENKEEFSSDLMIATTHHSMVEHMAYQEEYINDFCMDDWWNTANYLADFGIHYGFTGHSHQNDISHHLSFNNNQITDMQTAASLAYGAAVRYATIKRGTLGEEKIEDLYVKLDYLEEVDITYAFDNGYITEDAIEAKGLGRFFDISDTSVKINDFQGFTEEIFVDGILGMIEEYLNPSIIETLKAMLSGAIENVSFLGIDIGAALGGKIGDLVDVLVSEINNKVLADYEYSGSNPDYENNKIFGFLNEMVDKLLNFDLPGELTLLDFASYAYLGYGGGGEATSLEGVPEEIAGVISMLRNGEFVEQLVGILLDKEEGLYFLVKELLETPIDISSVDGIPELLKVLGLLIGYDRENPLDASNIVLGEVLLNALNSDLLQSQDIGFSLDLEGQTIMGFLDLMLEDYLTDSLYIGIGELAGAVVEGFVTDSSFDGNAVNTKILLREGDVYTYTSAGRIDEKTVENGKLPSRIAVTFGANPATEKNFSWFTDRNVSSGTIQYMKKSEGDFNENQATSVLGETQVYGMTKGGIDLGLFALLRYTEKARHTVNLTGLDAGTEYSYRVGWADRDYWSDVYTFETAPAGESAPFEVLLITDPQGYSKEAYQRILKVMDKAETVFDDKYSFIINAGDIVEYSSNTTQFDYYFNGLREHLANTSQVVAVGNHGDSSFDVSKDKEAAFLQSSESVYTEPYNNVLAHYNFDLPEQDSVNGAYYSYDYSGVHFTVLNTNDTNDNGLNEGQLNWLKADLAATTKNHKVVIMHKSIFSAGPHTQDAEIIGMKQQLPSIFEEYGVNLVLSGHDHTYSESYYLDGNGEIIKSANNKTEKIGSKGTLYVSLGTIGDKRYKYQSDSEAPLYTGAEIHDPYLFNPTFGKLTFDGKDLFYQGYEYDIETDTVNEIKPPFRLSQTDIILISVGSAVGAGGIGTGIFFLIKFLKKKKLAA